MAGNEPPSRNGVTYRVTFTVLISGAEYTMAAKIGASEASAEGDRDIR